MQPISDQADNKEFQTSKSEQSPRDLTPRLGFWAFLQREFEHVGANPRVVVLLVGLTLLPALFLLIQVASAWDPYGNLNKLPVGLVVLDRGTTYANQRIELGAEVKKNLLDKKSFDFRVYPSEAAVREAVDKSEVYFAAVVPADFSEKALRGEGANPSKLTLISAEGTSYFSNRLGKSFATSLSDTVNQTLEEKRWSAVISNLGSASDGLGQLKAGVGKLRDGAKKLSEGSSQLSSGAQALSTGLQTASGGSAQLAAGAKGLGGGVKALTGGVGQLGDGVRLMASKLPSQAQLEQLSTGAHQIQSGNAELANGLNKLSTGSNQLAQGGADLKGGLEQLSQGSNQLVQGSASLKSGLEQLKQGSATLSEKSGELAAGTAKLNSINFGGPNSPLSEGLRQINQGANALHQGNQSLAEGIAKADAGAAQVNSGANQLAQGLAKANNGATQLSAGASQLAANATKAAQGAQKLSTGADSLASGVDQLTGGVGQLSSGLRTIKSKLPAQSDLDKLSNGAATLASKSGELSAGLGRLNAGGQQLAKGSADLNNGAQQLANGLEVLYQKIPSAPNLSGDAKGLSNSVQLEFQNLHPVANNGLATAPLFAGFALWMGVLILAMMFNFNHLPEQAKGEPQVSKVLIKLATPALISAIQAVFSGLLVVYWMKQTGSTIAHPLAFFAVLLWASQAFIAVVSAIMMLMGGAGRALVSLLLILQFVSAGGTVPIELSPPFFQAIHPWLPVTHLLEAMRATLFGSYAGNWQTQTLILMAFTLGGLVVCILVGRRWHYIKNEDYKLEPVLLN